MNNKLKLLVEGEIKKATTLVLSEGIKHLEDLKPDQLLDFLGNWNLDKKKFHVSEKVDGNYMAFGLQNGKFYVRSKNVVFKSEEDVPKLFFLKDFERYFALLKNVPLHEIVSKLAKKYKFPFSNTIKIEGEAIPSYDHNIVMYDEKKIGDGVFVIFGTKAEDEAVRNQKIWKDLAKEINKYTSVNFYAVPEIDLSRLKFNNDLIISLEDIIRKHGNFLKKPARTPEDKELKQNVLAAVKEIGMSAKQQALQTKFSSLFGDEYEGIVIATPAGDLVKVVEKGKFTTRKETNWHFIDMLIKTQNEFKKKIKSNPEAITGALTDWNRELRKIKKDYAQNKDKYITIPKKGRDTEQSLELDQKMIDTMVKMLEASSPEEVVQKYFSKEIVPEGIKRTNRRVFLESLMREGGAIFDETNSVVPREFLETNIEFALKNAGLGKIKYELVGNVNKDYLGDIDIGVDGSELQAKLKLSEENFWEDLDKFLSKKVEEGKYKILRGLKQFHLLSPLVNQEGKQIHAVSPEGEPLDKPGLIQIDVFIGNLGWMKDIVSGAPKESKYKAVCRNLLLASIFAVVRWQSSKDPATHYKLTMNPREGFKLVLRREIPPSAKRKKPKMEKISEKTFSVNPDVVAQVLFGRPFTWGDINSFEKLFKLFKSQKFRFKKSRKQVIDDFKLSLGKIKSKVPTELGK